MGNDDERQLPAPSETFRSRMKEARQACKPPMSQQALAERLNALGNGLNQPALARIERGDRKVSLDEAIAISAALDVAPVNLFLPITDDHAEVRLAPSLAVNLRKAQRWARGMLPLRPGNFEVYLSQAPAGHAISREELSPEQYREFREKRLRELAQAGVDIEDITDELGGELYRLSPSGTMDLQLPMVPDLGTTGKSEEES